MADVRQLIKDHQLAVVGTLAAVAVAGVTVFRKAPAPVTVTLPAAAGGGTGSADLLSAFSSGASAASSGFDTGAALGEAGIGAAGQAESDVAGVAGELAQSQAQLAGYLGQLFQPVPLPVLQPPPPPVSPPPPTQPPPVSPPPPTGPTLHHATAVGSSGAGIVRDTNGVRTGSVVSLPKGTALSVYLGSMSGLAAWIVASGTYTGYAFNANDPEWSVA